MKIMKILQQKLIEKKKEDRQIMFAKGIVANHVYSFIFVHLSIFNLTRFLIFKK